MAAQSVKEEALPLFESRQAKGTLAYRLFAPTVLLGIFLIWVYRIVCIPSVGEQGRWVWIGMFVSELWFGLYWICTQSVRWNVVYRYPFKDRLSERFGHKLPGVDVFVCTADPIIEPPLMVVNTVLSAMAYEYPTDKLSVYLSDDGCSDLTFYAFLEASHFSKHWIPFCKGHQIERRSPEAYFAQDHDIVPHAHQEWLAVKKLYEEMRKRIETTIDEGSISTETRDQHRGFSEWNQKVTKGHHQSIVQIIIDGRDTGAVDNDGCRLPTLVYIAREKRPHVPHNFKAGATNALLRVSSEISNGSVILNLDCDMYANDSEAVKEALCFFMDEERGHEIAYLQHPQIFSNITKNDLYGNAALATHKVELAGIGGYGAALYCGTGCFHRRESLCGKNYSKGDTEKLNIETKKNVGKTVHELEKTSRVLADCSYEKGTQWGKDMGLLYGCPVEDVCTGLVIQCRGWKSVYYCPNKEAFLGVAPNTLDIALIQHKRWSEGLFQIFFSKYCPFIYGHGKLKLGAQMGYCVYFLWAPVSLPTLYYAIVPPLCMLRGIPLFPQMSSLWFAPFAYVFVSRNVHSIVEALSCGSTLKGWWNLQRMIVLRRTTSYFFAFIDILLKQVGLSRTAFAVTAKVVKEDVLKRYETEVMEFGSSTVMFTIVATLAMLNLFALMGSIMIKSREMLIPQIILCSLVISVNEPLYRALFLRSDKGKLPPAVVFKSIVLASLACLMSLVKLG